MEDDRETPLLRIAIATALIGVGWSISKAQTAVADFEIAVDAPRGDVKLTSSRCCDWGKREGNPSRTTSFQCETERWCGTFKRTWGIAGFTRSA